VVGVNRFEMEEEEPMDLLRVDPAVRVSQIEKLKGVREHRDEGAVKSALADLERAATGDDNIMPHILTAVRAYATLGEICGVLRGVFGEYQQINTLG